MSRPSELATHLDTYSFARRLRQAVHDKSHEDDPEIGLTHFWDASCLVVPIRGHRALPPQYPNVSQAQQLELLVGALFSSGQIGHISMLPGHSLEMVTEIRESMNQKIDERDIRLFVGAHLERLAPLSDLLESVPRSDRPIDPAIVAEVVKRLKSLDPSLFVIIESLTRSTARRVRKWLSDRSGVRFVDYPGGKAFRIEQKPFSEFYDALNRSRPQDRRSNAVDASVLRTLVDLNNAGPPYPRFYTNTPTLTRLYSSSKWVRDYFSFFIPHDSVDRTAHTIWRNAEYYYLRSLFPALRVGEAPKPESAPNSESGNGPSFEELARLSSELDRALDAEQFHEFDTIVRGFTFDNGQRLQDIVDGFSGIGMANAWVNLRFEDVAKELVDGAGQLTRVSEDIEFRNAVEDMWRAFDLATRSVLEISRTVESVKLVCERLAKMRGRYPGSTDVPDATDSIADDLLAYRWGGRMHRRLGRMLIDAMNGQPDSSNLTSEFALSNLATDSRRAATAMAVFYGLEMYAEAESLASQLPDHWTVETELLRLAARLRGAKDAQEAGGIGLVLAQLWNDASASERLRLCLGFGHCHLQVVMKGGSMSRPATEQLPKSSAQRRGHLQLAKIRRYIARNLANIRADDEVWYAFSLNFLVHSQTIDPLEDFVPSDERNYLELASLCSQSARIERQYRFADSILYRDLQRAIGDLSTIEDPSGPCRRLRETVNGFESLQGKTRSRTVHAHLLEAEAAWRLYKCADLDVT